MRQRRNMLISQADWERLNQKMAEDTVLVKSSSELTNITLNENLNIRLQDLKNNLAQEWRLLKSYEDALRYEDDPRRQAKYKHEIQQQRKLITRYYKEFQQLQGQISSLKVSNEPEITIQMVSNQIQQVDTKLSLLQTVVHDDLATLRNSVLQHYEKREQIIISSVTNQLDRTNLEALRIIFNAIEANRLSNQEMYQTLEMVQQSLAFLTNQNLALPYHSQVAEVINSPQLDIRHKFEVALPIIPLFLNYKGEIELESGINIEKLWNKLVAKVRGNQSN